MRTIVWITVLAALPVLSLFSADNRSFDPETLAVMPFVDSKKSCESCHKGADLAAITNPAQACDTQCMTCHTTDIKRHHSVGVKQEKRKTQLHLSTTGRVMCITCHDLNNKRFDTVPWKSQSLFGKMFSGSSRYKTFFLPENNSGGELCTRCHSVGSAK